MEKKEIRLRKIPLQAFLDALIEIYNMGIDYVDIVGKPDEVQDSIGIVFSDEYFSKEHRKDYYDKDVEETPPTNEDSTSKINIKLSDEDLNQLL